MVIGQSIHFLILFRTTRAPGRTGTGRASRAWSARPRAAPAQERAPRGSESAALVSYVTCYYRVTHANSKNLPVRIFRLHIWDVLPSYQFLPGLLVATEAAKQLPENPKHKTTESYAARNGHLGQKLMRK